MQEEKAEIIIIEVGKLVTGNMNVAWEEPFGPVLPIIRVKSDEEAVLIANKSEFGLQANFNLYINDQTLI